MAKTPEGKVKGDIKKWLNRHDIWFFMPVSNGFGLHGIPDIICCFNGAFIGIEVKAPGKINNVSELQKQVHLAIGASGGLAVVVDSVSALETIFVHRFDFVREHG